MMMMSTITRNSSRTTERETSIAQLNAATIGALLTSWACSVPSCQRVVMTSSVHVVTWREAAVTSATWQHRHCAAAAASEQQLEAINDLKPSPRTVLPWCHLAANTTNVATTYWASPRLSKRFYPKLPGYGFWAGLPPKSELLVLGHFPSIPPKNSSKFFHNLLSDQTTYGDLFHSPPQNLRAHSLELVVRDDSDERHTWLHVICDVIKTGVARVPAAAAAINVLTFCHTNFF